MSPLTRRQFIGASAGAVLAVNTLALPAPALEINPRSSWAADLPPQGPLDREDVRFLIVHHSASHNGHRASDVPDILRGWYRFHTGPDKGWPDIAYNFIIDSEGGVWEGRQGSLDRPVAGSATGGNQGFTQLICVIGDTNQTPATPAATASLVRVLAWLADRYDISTVPGAEATFTSRGSNKWPSGTRLTTPTIAGHRDMSQTTCPGEDLYSYVAGSLRVDVDAARRANPSSGLQPPTTTTLPATTTSESSTTTTVAPSTTSTTLSSTTTAVSPSTKAAPTPTLPESPTTVPSTTASPPTTIPVATDPLQGGPSGPTGPLLTAGAMLLGGAGLLAWRHRRMGGPR